MSAVRVVAAASPRAAADRGRLVVVPLFSLLLVANVVVFAGSVRQTRSSAFAAGVNLVATTLIVTFYVVVISAYLRRGPATASTSSWTARVAAAVATGLPMLLPLIGRGRGTSLGHDVLGSALIVFGLAWSVWSLKSLGTNVSVIAQVRRLASSGPYRWVRHPVYLGELVTALGIAVRGAALGGFLLWLALLGLQAYRAVVEERLLRDRQPGYSDYCCGTARFLPGLF